MSSEVKPYTRVVNGKTVQVNAYSKEKTASSSVLSKSRQLPGRPQMAARPGSYSSGRDVPGITATLGKKGKDAKRSSAS